ncbi:MAG: bacillithiol system redox-active protein YtxJ [Gemmatimonadaceae bacterium]
MRRLTSLAELEEALRETPLLLVYKHSGACGISTTAWREIAHLEQAAPSLPIFLLDVIEQRALARAVAAALDVHHESPQAILVRDGTVIWHGSHFAVTAAVVLGRMESEGG